uniref:Uncharacterized protein n=1 Tax=Timema poppense TaxID=170557 RepID=A0A7R9DGC3_TIMPO|nr:unnamed protein product [Timema poppensis]
MMLGPSQLRRMRGSKLLGFLNLPVTSKRTLVHLRKHWDIVKSRRKRQLVEETVELMSTGRGPYNSHKPSCSKVEISQLQAVPVSRCHFLHQRFKSRLYLEEGKEKKDYALAVLSTEENFLNCHTEIKCRELRVPVSYDTRYSSIHVQHHDQWNEERAHRREHNITHILVVCAAGAVDVAVFVVPGSEQHPSIGGQVIAAATIHTASIINMASLLDRILRE